MKISLSKWHLTVGILAGVMINACTHVVTTPALPVAADGCDTIHVTYRLAVQPILKDSCYSCHSSAISASQGIIDLEDFNSLSDYLKETYQLDTTMGVKFMHVIEQRGSVPDMPPTGKLTNCELAIIEKWIRNGAHHD